jgi:transcriptional antiterminator RfaH
MGRRGSTVAAVKAPPRREQSEREGPRDMRRWFVVKTHPRRELQVSGVLARREIEVYLPQIPARQRSGHRPARLEPLFPGYLFSRLELGSAEWIAARSAPGVAYFLGAGGVPSALPDEFVEGIQAQIEARGRESWRPPFDRGDRVVIEGGPLGGLEAVFHGMVSPTGRVRVLLEVVSRLVPVELDVGLLRRAG